MSNYNETEQVFRPVKCTEDKLNSLETRNGYLYFTTDTKKVFLGNDNKKIQMCESKGFYYGKKVINYPTDGTTPVKEVDFIFSNEELVSEIEGTNLPEIDDLILNIGTSENPDGCFYRVESITADELSEQTILHSIRLTLQGTGGGGGGTGPGEPSMNFTVNLVGSKKKVFSSQATELSIEFQCNYAGDPSANEINSVAFSFKGEEPFYEEYNNPNIGFNKINKIDLIDKKNLFNYTAKTVYMTVTDKWGLERTTNFSIQLLTLELKKTMDEILSSFVDGYNGNNFEYRCELTGAADEIKAKTIFYKFYREDNLVTPYREFSENLDATAQGSIAKILNLSDFEHGSYILEVSAQVELNTSNLPIPSNKLLHKISVYMLDGNVPIFSVKFPEKAEMHTNIPVYYEIASAEMNKQYTVKIDIDGKEKTQLSALTNTLYSYDFYFEEKVDKQYNIRFTVLELNNEYQYNLIVNAYQGTIPVIDPQRSDLMLFLNPRERSNDEVNKNIWLDYSERKNELNEVIQAKLNNFHYGAVNGWMKDNDGTSYLSLTSGANINVSNFKPFANDLSTLGKSGMTIELDFEINGVLNYETELIRCISSNAQNTINYVGFGITGNKLYFYNNRLNGGENGALMSLNLVEGKRIRVSFVIEPRKNDSSWFPMCYTYLDGVLSSAVLYDKNLDTFNDGERPAQLTVDSSNANIKLYSVRFYSTALTHREILNNYTASFGNKTLKEEKYNTNNVFDVRTGMVDFNRVAAEGYDLQIPYMKITGGWSTLADSKWQLKDQENANVGLPTGKKDYRMIDVEVKYPNNDYFKNYEDYQFINQFSNGKTMAEAYGERPTNGGCIMYAQGTSSMEYPVKNLRIRFKKDEDFYQVRPNIAPVEIICMKADYMESSGSHNTGTGNLVDALYKGVGIQTPGQKQFNQENEQIVTCIKGHPCLIFYSPTGAPNSYEYIGKYNLNLDKATPEPFGFAQEGNFGYLPIGYEYYDESKSYQEDDKGDLEYIGTNAETSADLKTVADGDKVNSIYCFEFLDNAVEVCNFIPRSGKTYQQTWYDTFTNKENEKVPGWTLGFESRYPEDKIGYHDADALYPFASWVNELYTQYLKDAVDSIEYVLATEYNSATRYYIKKENEYEIAYPTESEFANGEYYIQKINWKDRNAILEKEYKYEYKPEKNFEEGVQYYVKEEGEKYVEAYPTSQEQLNSKTHYVRSVIFEKFKALSLERFKREYQCYLDRNFLLTYYLLTEALLMADSRVKNMMIATWGPEKRTYKELKDDNTEVEHETNNYIWYPIFYDMDTMMGLDNTGVYRFNYYDEDTNSTLFNGDEVLWILTRDALQDELIPWYTKMEESLLTIGKDKDGKDIGILPYYNNNQANMANEAFYNGDADYKYITPAKEGYRDDSTGKDISPGVGPYLYAAQGSRSLMREWFLTNRIKFLRGKYNSKNYQSSDRIEFRWYYPDGNLAVEPSGTFDFTALRTGYAGVLLGANGNVYNERFDQAGQTKSITLPEAAGANGTEAYILGVSNLTDLGDLSNKYVQKFIISSDDVKLEKLKLGNGKQGYNNIYLGQSVGGEAPKIDVTKCTQLKEFNLYNCAAYNSTLDFSKCKAIEEIYLTGSGVSGITLPINGVLKELRLPNTVTIIRINSHSALTKDNFSIGNYDYLTGNTMEKDKYGNRVGKFNNDYSLLDTLNIINTNIDTYNMVKDAKSLRNYCLQGINWNITDDDTQYCVVSEQEFNPSIIYWYWDDNKKEYQKYDNSKGYPINSNPVIYEKFDMLSQEVDEFGRKKITCIPVLERLKRTALDKGTDYTLNLVPADALTGIITIDIPDSSVVELEIYETYHSTYPNLEFVYGKNVSVSEAKRIEFYDIDDERLSSGVLIENVSPYYFALTDGNKTLSQLTGSNLILRNPIKTSTSSDDYNFTGIWIDWNTRIEYYQDNAISSELLNSLSSEQLDRRFSVFKPQTNMKLVPRFDKSPRLYTIEFYNEGYPNVINKMFDVSATYNQTLHDAIKSTVNAPYEFYNYIEKDGLAADEKYNFEGWIKEIDLKDEIISSLSDIHITGNLKMIAKYNIRKVDDPEYTTNINCFDVRNGTISVRASYRSILKGKITLSLQYQGIDLHTVGDFKGTEFTELYFASGNSKYKTVSSGAFSDQSSLTIIDLPSSIIEIGDSAFRNCSSLTTLGNYQSIEKIIGPAFQNCILLNLDLDTMKNLNEIGGSAFGHTSGTANNIVATKLPERLTVLNDFAFLNCPNIRFVDFTQLTKMGNGYKCLGGCGKGTNAVKNIIVKAYTTGENGQKIVVVNKNAFGEYGNLSTVTFKYENGETKLDPTIVSLMGFGSVTYIHDYSDYDERNDEYNNLINPTPGSEQTGDETWEEIKND